MSREIEAIIFDYDGVVVTLDKEKALQAARPHLESFLISPEIVLTELYYDEAQNRPLDLGQVTIEQTREAMRLFAWQGERQTWFDWWNIVDDCFYITQPMKDLLESLRKEYRLALLTDNHIGFRQWLQHRPDIGQYFDVVICSAEQKITKPDPQIFLHTVAQLGTLCTKTIFLDDVYRNIVSAEKLGIRGIHVVSPEQACQNLRELLSDFKDVL